jgi:hypothetical protein
MKPAAGTRTRSNAYHDVVFTTSGLSAGFLFPGHSRPSPPATRIVRLSHPHANARTSKETALRSTFHEDEE